VPSTSPAFSTRTGTPTPRPGVLLPAGFLLAGQVLFIVVTQFHAGGDANSHSSVFATYAASESWKVVHLGQFAAMAVLLAGLLGLFVSLDRQASRARWAGRCGAAATVATLALYGVLQAVDGVALQQAVTAWVTAPDPEKATRFATAETVRWLEWGVRSYQNLTLGLALLLLAAAVRQARSIPRPVAPLAGLAGLTHLAQGWVVGSEGFSPLGATAIVLGFALNVVWMTWLLVGAWRTPDQG
jgi:hypothetical protein